jgi:hypothetical protein
MTNHSIIRQTCFAWVCALSIQAGFAQSPGTPVDVQGANVTNEEKERITRTILALRDEGKIIGHDEIKRQLENPEPELVSMPDPRTMALSTEEIAVHARKANLRVGYAYLCPRCEDWHVELAGGYAIAGDVVVTCEHVVNAQTKMREGYLVVMDHEGRVAGAAAILARSAAMDAAVVKVAGASFTPVPLNHNVAQGAAAHCFSNPLRQRDYFSSGIINRFYWNNKYNGGDRESVDALQHLRADFSTHWAPGSSGSPLLDQAGNVIAHVSTISSLDRGKDKPTLLTMRTGIPARSVERLVETMSNPAEIQRLAKSDAPRADKAAAAKEDDTPEGEDGD